MNALPSRRRAIRLAATALLAGLLLPAAHADEEKLLNLYNWSEYIGENTVRDFERETGIKVRYDNFDSNEVLLVKMIAGRSGYDIDKVQAALGAESLPANPFELVFNPKYTAKLKGCGISMLDSASDVFPSALGYGGDFSNAAERARAAGSKVRIAAPLPPGGVQFGFESMMIPADAPHPQNAHKWIDHILRAEVQAQITNKLIFTSPNAAARKFIRPDVLANPLAFPPDEYLATKAQFYEVRCADTRRAMTRAFTKFKSGV